MPVQREANSNPKITRRMQKSIAVNVTTFLIILVMHPGWVDAYNMFLKKRGWLFADEFFDFGVEELIYLFDFFLLSAEC